MQNNAITISDNLDAEVTKLDTVSQNIIYSSILKEEFSDYIEYQQSHLEQTASSPAHKESLVTDHPVTLALPCWHLGQSSSHSTSTVEGPNPCSVRMLMTELLCESVPPILQGISPHIHRTGHQSDAVH